jgi:hypothetical protein
VSVQPSKNTSQIESVDIYIFSANEQWKDFPSSRITS